MADQVTHLNINEHFGPTIQGEGRHAGRLASFLRLSGCNLSCSWCDTPYTWDWSRYERDAETHRMEMDEAIATMAGYPGRLVISGGEPLVQARGLAQLLDGLRGREVDLETNGTRNLGETAGAWSTITCSPKIIGSAGQDHRAHRIVAGVLEVADFKFVVETPSDLEDVELWLREHDEEVDPARVWLMPEGTDHLTLTARTPWLMEQAVRLGTNFTTRLHVYGWADTRGH